MLPKIAWHIAENDVRGRLSITSGAITVNLQSDYACQRVQLFATGDIHLRAVLNSREVIITAPLQRVGISRAVEIAAASAAEFRDRRQGTRDRQKRTLRIASHPGPTDSARDHHNNIHATHLHPGASLFQYCISPTGVLARHRSCATPRAWRYRPPSPPEPTSAPNYDTTTRHIPPRALLEQRRHGRCGERRGQQQCATSP